MADHPKILLKNVSHPDQSSISGAESRGAYSTIRKVLQMDPQAVVSEITKSGLRGRGGAGFLTGKKWSFVPRDGKKPVYIAHNADESEPGTFKDRLLLERDPHLVIEGTLVAAWAVQAKSTVIYIRGEYSYPYIRLQKAINEAYQKGYLGENIFGSNFSHHMIIHRGAGAYICGEETALLESVEGRKGMPRLKPPFFPAVIGLYGCPTVVNNTETLATCVWIMSNGADAFRAIGTEKSPGTKLISASGHINKPGVFEVSMGYPVLDFINNECGGVWKGRNLKAVIPGGSSMPVLKAGELAGLTLDFDSLQKAGSALGSGGFMVMDETASMVEVACNVAHFYAHESCGQCTPCREGGHWIEKIFNRIRDGFGREEDLPLIKSICSQIAGHTICAFGEALAMPAVAFIEKYEEEFLERIRGSTSKSAASVQTIEPARNG